MQSERTRRTIGEPEWQNYINKNETKLRCCEKRGRALQAGEKIEGDTETRSNAGLPHYMP